MEQKDKEQTQDQGNGGQDPGGQPGQPGQDPGKPQGPTINGVPLPTEIKLTIDEQQKIKLQSPFAVPDTCFMFLRALLVLGTMQPGPPQEGSRIVKPGGGSIFKRKP